MKFSYCLDFIIRNTWWAPCQLSLFLQDDFKEDLQDETVGLKYKSLIGIHAGKGKGGLDGWLRVDPDKVRRLSLSERELENAAIIFFYLLDFYKLEQ